MRKSEIKVGGNYVAKVSGSATIVRVESIVPVYDPFAKRMANRYHCTNLRSGRAVVAKSAARFRKAVPFVVGDVVKLAQPERFSRIADAATREWIIADVDVRGVAIVSGAEQYRARFDQLCKA